MNEASLLSASRVFDVTTPGLPESTARSSTIASEAPRLKASPTKRCPSAAVPRTATKISPVERSLLEAVRPGPTETPGSRFTNSPARTAAISDALNMPLSYPVRRETGIEGGGLSGQYLSVREDVYGQRGSTPDTVERVCTATSPKTAELGGAALPRGLTPLFPRPPRHKNLNQNAPTVRAALFWLIISCSRRARSHEGAPLPWELIPLSLCGLYCCANEARKSGSSMVVVGRSRTSPLPVFPSCERVAINLIERSMTCLKTGAASVPP